MNSFYLALIFYLFIENKKEFNNLKSFKDINLYNIETSFQIINESQKFKGIFNHLDFDNEREILLAIKTINNDLINNNNFHEWFTESLNEMYTRNVMSERLSNDSLKALISNLVTSEIKENIKVYDPALGSGGLLIELNKHLKASYYGEEIDEEIFNIARMNFIINEIGDFKINLSNSIKNNYFKDEKFDLIITEPPFTLGDLIDSNLLNDHRFKEYKDESIRAITDYKYIIHSLSSLKEDGTLVLISPPRALFAELSKSIRKDLIVNKNYLDTVITLPENILSNTSIATAILIFKKKRNKEDKVLFINTNKFFKKQYHKNILTKEGILKIKNIYNKRLEEEKISKLVNISEINENDYNLNINRYIKTFKIESRKSNEELFKENQKLSEKHKELEKSFYKKITDF